MLHLPRTLPHQRIAVPPQHADGAHLGGRAEGRTQQPDGMQVLQPLAVLHVGLAAGHVLDVAGIDQANRDAGLFEHLRQRNPINAGRLHRDGVDATLAQPRDERPQLIGERAEAAHARGTAIRWHRHVNLAGTDVGARSVGLKRRQRRRGGCFGFAHGGGPPGGPAHTRIMSKL